MYRLSCIITRSAVYGFHIIWTNENYIRLQTELKRIYNFILDMRIYITIIMRARLLCTFIYYVDEFELLFRLLYLYHQYNIVNIYVQLSLNCDVTIGSMTKTVRVITTRVCKMFNKNRARYCWTSEEAFFLPHFF